MQHAHRTLVIAPVSAPWTSLAYLPSTPRRVARRVRRPALPATRPARRRRRAGRASCVVHVDPDPIAVADEGDRPTVDRLRRDVADAETPRPTGETTVGDQRAVGAPTGALQRPGDGQHLAHPRARPSGPRSGSPAPCPARSCRPGSRPSPPSSPSKTRAGPSNVICSLVNPATLTTEPSGASEPREDVDAALGVDRRVERWTTTPSGCGGSRSSRFSAIVLPVTVRHVTVQQPGVEELLEHDRHAADAIEVGHVELAAGLHVGDVRHPGGDAVEVVEVQLDPGLVGDRQQVQHGVGRPADGRRQRRWRSRTPAWS